MGSITTTEPRSKLSASSHTFSRVSKDRPELRIELRPGSITSIETGMNETEPGTDLTRLVMRPSREEHGRTPSQITSGTPVPRIPEKMDLEVHDRGVSSDGIDVGREQSRRGRATDHIINFKKGIHP
jgi:hypothetical protein